MASIEARRARNEVTFEVRAIPARLIVVDRDETTPLVERIVFRGARSSIVRKIGLAADVARELTDAA